MAENHSKKDLPSQVNDQEVPVLLLDHFSAKTNFFKLELFLVCFYLFSFIFSEFC